MAVCLLCGCSDYSKITITNVKDVKISPVGGGKFEITLNANIHNPTRRKIKLRTAVFEAQQKNMPFAMLTLLEPIVIQKNSNDQHSLKLELRLQNVLLMLMGFNNLSVEDFTIDGKITASTFPLRKTIRINAMPLKEFEAQYGSVFSAFLKN
jgi:hypothetical protein